MQKFIIEKKVSKKVIKKVSKKVIKIKSFTILLLSMMDTVQHISIYIFYKM